MSKPMSSTWRKEYRQRPHVKSAILRRLDLNRGAVLWYKMTHPCVDCRESDFVVLQFDHVRGQRRFFIGSGNSAALFTLLKEIRKCDVVCANCHARRTKIRGQQDGFRLDGQNYRRKVWGSYGTA